MCSMRRRRGRRWWQGRGVVVDVAGDGGGRGGGHRSRRERQSELYARSGVGGFGWEQSMAVAEQLSPSLSPSAFRRSPAGGPLGSTRTVSQSAPSSS